MSNYYYGASDLTSGYYVSHHGILGQKWGIRRFQNKDGTLTAAGKKRYGKSEAKILSANVTSKTQSDLYKKVAKTKLYKDIENMEADNLSKLLHDTVRIYSKVKGLNDVANQEAAEAVRNMGGKYKYIRNFNDLITNKELTTEEFNSAIKTYMETGEATAKRIGEEIREEYAKTNLKEQFHNIEKEIRDYTKQALSESTINSEMKAEDALMYSKDSGLSKQKLDGALYNTYYAKAGLSDAEQIVYALDEKYNK